MPAVESGLVPWQLTQPTSREVAVPGATRGRLVIAGGLTTGDVTTSSVSDLAVPGGVGSPAGALATATHDAAAAVLAGCRVLVFGGGNQTSVATVQEFALSATGSWAAATVVGQLPQPRSDAVAVTIGGTAYVIGGYDGTRADAEVLATTNGTSFRDVGALPVPVRYAAAASLGHRIYVFGGQRVGGTAAAVNAIQSIDTRTGRSR